MTNEPTAFLYPFIEADERDVASLLVDLAASALGKIAESVALRDETRACCRPDVRLAAVAMAERFRGGGRLFAFGNGGSATDAEGAVGLFRAPPRGRPLPALSLVDDRAVLTALANDVGFELVFSRQLDAHARPGDMAMGFSTSGDSKNVLRAFETAHRAGLSTIGLCGYEGGLMATSECVDHCLVVRSDSVHRIQEAQAALVLDVWDAVQDLLEEGNADD
jgi:D-sedoheptulose 7-phosphate isomerase